MALVRGSTGQVVARYSYDAWGKCTVTNASGYTVGTKNPFRYRGYYYDAETGLYYLNSRYYNPEFGRFISADVFVSTGQGLQGANMFAYCGNNPVNRADPSGCFFGTLVGGIAGGIGGFVGALVNGDDPLKGALIGAGTGALAGAAVDFAVATGGLGGVAIAVLGGAAAAGADSALTDVANGRGVNWKKAGISAGIGGLTNLLSFGLVNSSTLKSGGNVLRNFVENGKRQLMANTRRMVSGRVVPKSSVGVAKNVAQNILTGSTEAAIVSSFNMLLNRGVSIRLN